MTDFDIGDESYDEDEFGTPWWLDRATDPAHKRAYRTIAKCAAKYAPDAKHIVDYACGPALLIRELFKVFPEARITGLDESAAAFEAAEQVLKRAKIDSKDRRLRLTKAALPDFDLRIRKADVAIFCFPDFRGGGAGGNIKHWRKHFPGDWQATKALRKKWNKKADEDFPIPPSKEMFYKRIAGLNLRKLVKKGGIIIRVDYANCDRDECEKYTLREMQWTEGSFAPTKTTRKHLGKSGGHFTEIIGSKYRESTVMEDVYHQTEDEDDKEGGYLISVMKAI